MPGYLARDICTLGSTWIRGASFMKMRDRCRIIVAVPCASIKELSTVPMLQFGNLQSYNGVWYYAERGGEKKNDVSSGPKLLASSIATQVSQPPSGRFKHLNSGAKIEVRGRILPPYQGAHSKVQSIARNRQHFWGPSLASSFNMNVPSGRYLDLWNTAHARTRNHIESPCLWQPPLASTSFWGQQFATKKPQLALQAANDVQDPQLQKPSSSQGRKIAAEGFEGFAFLGLHAESAVEGLHGFCSFRD